jgi:hypothetical protein
MVPDSCTVRLQELDEMFRDDFLLAWLQHERVHGQAIGRSFEHDRRFDFGGYEIEAAPPFFVQRFVILFQIELKSFDHVYDFFFANLCAAAQRVFMRGRCLRLPAVCY